MSGLADAERHRPRINVTVLACWSGHEKCEQQTMGRWWADNGASASQCPLGRSWYNQPLWLLRRFYRVVFMMEEIRKIFSRLQYHIWFYLKLTHQFRIPTRIPTKAFLGFYLAYCYVCWFGFMAYQPLKVIQFQILLSISISIYIYIVSLATVVEGTLFYRKAPRRRGGRYFFPWIASFTLDLYLIMLSVKQGTIKYHLLSQGIEPFSPRPLANIVTIMQIVNSCTYHYFYASKSSFDCTQLNCFK